MKVVSASLRAVALGLALAASSASAQQKVLKFIPQADLRILDPIATTAYITRNHGYMVYDTLFATDANFQIQPQMVDKWELSKDKLTYTFTLRDGLKFHDGQPVRSADCIASLERWAKRDALGQKLAEATESWSAVNDKTFRLKLKKPFALTLEALGRLSSNVPFIMPERIAKTDAFQNITDATGSGPFKFVKEEWVPGQQGRLREEHRLRAAQGAAVLGRRRQSGESRSRRVDLHPRFGHGRRGAQRGRGRLVGAAAARSHSGAAQQQGRARREHRSARLDRHPPLQLPEPAVQQPEDARGAALRRQPEGLRARHRGRREERAHLLLVLHLRNAAIFRDRCRGAQGQARLRARQETDPGVGLQGREDRDHLGDRPADRPRAIAAHRRDAAQAGTERRAAGGRLGHAHHAAHVQGTGRERRLVDLPHVVRRTGRCLAGERADPRLRREGVVRLAQRPQAGGAARGVVQHHRRRPRPRKPPTRSSSRPSSSCPTSRPRSSSSRRPTARTSPA